MDLGLAHNSGICNNSRGQLKNLNECHAWVWEKEKTTTMNLESIFTLLGGLALFLYGMNAMCTGLEVAAGDRLKSILEKLTSNRLLGVLVGAAITAVIQSSSATTVMIPV